MELLDSVSEEDSSAMVLVMCMGRKTSAWSGPKPGPARPDPTQLSSWHKNNDVTVKLALLLGSVGAGLVP